MYAKNSFLIVLSLMLFGLLNTTSANPPPKPPWAGTALGCKALGNDYIDPDFAPLSVQGGTVISGFKQITLDNFGFPKKCSWRGQDIIKKPVCLVIDDDRAQVFLREGDFKITKPGKNAIEATAVFGGANLKIEVKSHFDFDFTIRYTITVTPLKGATEIRKFALVFSMNTQAEEEKLVMYHTETPEHRESGVAAQKRRVHLTIKGKDYREVAPGFCPSFWIGTTHYGMAWGIPDDRDWNSIKGTELTYDPGSGDFTMNMINKKTILDKPRHFEFYLTPTPFRTMPKNWRAWNYGWRGAPNSVIPKYVNQLIYWGSIWRGGNVSGSAFDPLNVRNPEELKRVAQLDKGMNKANYYIPQLIATAVLDEDEEGNIYVFERPYLEELAKKYCVTPQFPKKLDIPDDAIRFKTIRERNNFIFGDKGKKRKFTGSSRNWGVVFAPPIADMMVYGLNEFIKMGVGGIYYDGCSAMTDYRIKGWTDSNGEKRPVVHYDWQRQLLKRMRCIVKENNPNEIILAHQSGTRQGACISLCDAIIPGETFFYWYQEPEKRDASQNGDFYYAHIIGDIDNLKGEFFHRQWGIPHILLPEVRGKDRGLFKQPHLARGTRTMLAYTLHFDMLYFPTMCDVNEIYKLYPIRNEYGMADTEKYVVEFIPYWENRWFKADDPNIKLSYYDHVKEHELYSDFDCTKKIMLIASNLQFSDATFTITLPPNLKNAKVREMQSKKDIVVENGKFKYNLLAYDFAIFEVIGEMK
jgi:hypothetical protein